jgi:hypothetical protein
VLEVMPQISLSTYKIHWYILLFHTFALLFRL